MKPDSIDAAWEKFFAAKKLDDPQKLYKQGWRSPGDIASQLKLTTHAARMLCRRWAEAGDFETKKFRVNTTGNLLLPPEGDPLTCPPYNNLCPTTQP